MTGRALCVLAALFAASIQAAERPNILFIFADDWGWGDLSCHGHPYVKTPHIDRLAKEGTDFHRFTVASGVCSPSRTAVVTGQFPARHNIDGHFAQVSSNARRKMPDWLALDAPFLPRMLKMGGYFELYDIAQDPSEQTDLKERNPESVEQLLSKLKAWRRSLPPMPEGEVFSVERSGSN